MSYFAELCCALSCSYRNTLSVSTERIHIIGFLWPVNVFTCRRSSEYERHHFRSSSVENGWEPWLRHKVSLYHKHVRKCLCKHPLGKQATVTDILLYALFYMYAMTGVTLYFHEVYTAPCYSRMLWIHADTCTFKNPHLNMHSQQCVSPSQ